MFPRIVSKTRVTLVKELLIYYSSYLLWKASAFTYYSFRTFNKSGFN